MRTTVTLDDDVAALLDLLAHLLREGLARRGTRPRFTQTSSDMGALIDLGNIAEVLDLLESPDPR